MMDDSRPPATGEGDAALAATPIPPPGVHPIPPTPVRIRAPGRRAANRVVASLMIAGTLVLLLDLFILILGPQVAPYDRVHFNTPPNLGPSAEHLLGTDRFGHDVLSQKLYGAREPDGLRFVPARDTAKGRIILILEILALGGMVWGFVMRRRHPEYDRISGIVAGVILLAAVAHLIGIAVWDPIPR